MPDNDPRRAEPETIARTRFCGPKLLNADFGLRSGAIVVWDPGFISFADATIFRVIKREPYDRRFSVLECVEDPKAELPDWLRDLYLSPLGNHALLPGDWPGGAVLVQGISPEHNNMGAGWLHYEKSHVPAVPSDSWMQAIGRYFTASTP